FRKAGIGMADQASFLYFRMVGEIGAHQPAIPFPVVFRIGGGMNPYKSSAGLDVSLKRGFLCSIQYVPRRVQKDYSRILFQAVVIENGRIFSGIHRESLFLAHLYDGLGSGFDAAMPESCCF